MRSGRICLTDQIFDPMKSIRHVQYCAKVMQTNFDEIPAFSRHFQVISLEVIIRRYFSEISRHLLFTTA